ncbi:TPA: hypothetical protein I8Y21_005827 [Klebsiella oxytoca]|uniref:Uncharacterized protein n=1 Tax=Klebsiella oxytoca TaxID=571 RepID=A0AAN5LFG9_KLEOX|nr:hypothetical protein [Klebsiella oxytoca]
MAKSAQSQPVYLPYVCATSPSDTPFARAMHAVEQRLLDRVKDALNDAGVAWIDIRTKERSQPATTDNVEGYDDVH